VHLIADEELTVDEALLREMASIFEQDLAPKRSKARRKRRR
jgi:hypothetical protein